MAQQTEEKKLPPYLSYKTFSTYIEGLKVGIPNRIDRSVLGHLSGANQSWLLGALRFMELTTDDGKPTDRLKRLVEAEGPERQKRLQDLTRAAYPSLFREGFHLNTATPRQLEEAITVLGPSGDTIRRCLTFFVALVKDADMAISPHIKRATRATRAPKRRRPTNGAPPAANGSLLDEGTPDDVRPKSWAEVLAAKFPSFDPTWPDDVKSKWFDGFKRLMEKGEDE